MLLPHKSSPNILVLLSRCEKQRICSSLSDWLRYPFQILGFYSVHEVHEVHADGPGGKAPRPLYLAQLCLAQARFVAGDFPPVRKGCEIRQMPTEAYPELYKLFQKEVRSYMDSLASDWLLKYESRRKYLLRLQRSNKLPKAAQFHQAFLTLGNGSQQTRGSTLSISKSMMPLRVPFRKSFRMPSRTQPPKQEASRHFTTEKRRV
jgi:hypothetical protein